MALRAAWHYVLDAPWRLRARDLFLAVHGALCALVCDTADGDSRSKSVGPQLGTA